MTDMAMTADIDIYRAAKLYIDQHGDQAAIQVAKRIGRFSGGVTLAIGLLCNCRRLVVLP